MTGMDMSNAPTAAILWAFYLQLLTVGVVWIVVFRIVWVKSRSDRSTLPALFRQMTQYVSRCSNRELLRLGLGCLWILDGVLQAQPDMSSEFVPYVLVPLIDGQPSWLAALLTQGVLLWGQHPLLFDALAIWVQVALGLLIAFSDGVWLRVGLIASVGWAAVIWLAGEGLGGMLTGSASWFTGAPGSALIYAGAGLLLLLPQTTWRSDRARTLIARGIAVLWLLCALLQLAPTQGNWNGSNLVQWLGSMAAMQQPAWTSGMLREFGGMVAVHYPIWNAAFAVIMVLLSWLTWRHFGSRGQIWLSFVWLAATWGLGQDFGVLGGLGTDPNSAPVVALVLAAGIYQGQRSLTRDIRGTRG